MQWNASLYDDRLNFVYKYGEGLVNLLQPLAGEHILDVGCGTGHLTQAIHSSGAHVTGIDSSPHMIAQALEQFPHIPFSVQNILDITYHNQFDAIFSNAALHWVTQADQAATNMYTALKPGGRFVAELGGYGNVGGIINALKYSLTANGFTSLAEHSLWYFPSVGTYTSLLEKTGFTVTLAHYYDRETLLQGANGMHNWLEMFANVILNEVPSANREPVIEATIKRLEPTHFRNGNWYADYKRLQIFAKK